MGVVRTFGSAVSGRPEGLHYAVVKNALASSLVVPVPLSYAEFQRVDIRVGRVVAVDDFPEARKPAYKLRIDFGGEIGVKQSSALDVREGPLV